MILIFELVLFVVLVVEAFVVAEVSDLEDVVGCVAVSVVDAGLVVVFDLASVPAVACYLVEVVVLVVVVSDLAVAVCCPVEVYFPAAVFDLVSDLVVDVVPVEVCYLVVVSVQVVVLVVLDLFVVEVYCLDFVSVLVLHLDLILELVSSCSKVYSFLHDILHHIPAHLEQVLQDGQILDF